MKQLLRTVAIFCICSELFVACSNDTKSASSSTEEIKPIFDLAAARKAIEAINADYASRFALGDSVGLANLYTSDAKAMPPNMPAVSGRAAIQSMFGGLFKAMGPVNIAITTSDVWGTEAMLIEEGSFTMIDDEGKQIDKAKYLALWKMEDGKWKIFRDCPNSDLPALNIK